MDSAKSFSKVAVPTSLPVVVDQGFGCSASLGIVRLFTFSHSSGYAVVSHYGFHLNFPDV